MKKHRGIFLLLAAAALVAIAPAAFIGCKGNSAPIDQQAAVAPPPVLRARVAAGDPLSSDPLTNPLWRKAAWHNLVAPLHDTRTTPPTRAASLYTKTHLFIAFACVSPTDRTALEAGSLQDRVEVWLDTSAAQNGTDLFSITVTPEGHIGRTWYRCSSPPEPKEDGSPNILHPISEIPDREVPGLDVQIGRTQIDGQSGWTVVLAIPFQSLPLPLRIDPKDVKEGAHWRVNLIRADVVRKEGIQQDLVQSNLAPIYPACQQVSPYRMAELVLESAGSAVAFKPAEPGNAQ